MNNLCLCRVSSSIAQEKSEYLPPRLETSGDCKEEDSATLNLKWESYVLTWNFAKVSHHFLTKETFKVITHATRFYGKQYVNIFSANPVTRRVETSVDPT
jgi:hypothetical protein